MAVNKVAKHRLLNLGLGLKSDDCGKARLRHSIRSFLLYCGLPLFVLLGMIGIIAVTHVNSEFPVVIAPS